MSTTPGVSSVASAHGNPCPGCPMSKNPDGGHCYMFREEPNPCGYGPRAIKAENFRQAQQRLRELMR